MRIRIATITVAAVLYICVCPHVLAGQGDIEQVAGTEFGAAVNLKQKNLKAEGTIFLPDNARRVSAVIVLLERCPGCPLASQRLFGDPVWRKLSQTCECALLYFRLGAIRPTEAIPSVASDFLRNAAVGGSDALFLLLRRLGQESAHQELKDAPMVFWGWSSAASFGTTFAEQFPDRTVAFIRYHTHLRGLPADMKILSNIPALLIAGGKDETAGREDAETLWKSGRSKGAPWTFVIEPNATHGNSYETLVQSDNELVIPWLAEVIRQRVGVDRTTLRRVTDNSGWLGNIHTAVVAPHAIFQDSKIDASWLPNDASALGWQTVVRASGQINGAR